jgi:hypothetical protein
LAKYVICDSGSWAFAKRADIKVINKASNSGPLNVEPIAALIETACVDFVQADGGCGSDVRQRQSAAFRFHTDPDSALLRHPPPTGRDTIDFRESRRMPKHVETTPKQFTLEFAC